MTLRCNLFPTVYRGSTLYIAVRDTITHCIDEIDAYHMDAMHCRMGRLGIGWHFLILKSGDIQLCRHPATVGSHSRNLDEISVAVGIVGGKLPDGERFNTRTPDQLAALNDLLDVLHEKYPNAEVHDRPQS